MKSLQDKLSLILEGKGNKELFVKQAKAEYPNLLANVYNFDQAKNLLVNKGIVSEAVLGAGLAQPKQQDWIKIFKENVDIKADVKTTDKRIEDFATAGYDYKDKAVSANQNMQEILTGLYAEMDDPKNAEKSAEEIVEMVNKNLAKDPLYYVKKGQFGIKDLGYVDIHPGLGPTKEVTGKYASSGMEPVKLTESKSKIKEGYDEDKIAKYKKYTYTLGGKKVIPNDIDFYGHILGIEVDGEVYRPGTPDEKGNIELKPRKGKTGTYTESNYISTKSGEERLFEAKATRLSESVNEIGMFNDPIGYDRNAKSQLQLAREILADAGIPKEEIDAFISSNLFKKGKLSDRAKQYVDSLSTNEEAFLYGKKYNPDQEQLDDEDEIFMPVDDEGIPLEEERLFEAKASKLDKDFKRIDKMAEVAAWESKIAAIDEMITERKNKIAMTEADGVVDMVDKKKQKELKKEIALLEKRRAMYEKKCNRSRQMAEKVGGKKKDVVTDQPIEESVEETLEAKMQRMIKEAIKRRKNK